jgi:hypothetical protein
MECVRYHASVAQKGFRYVITGTGRCGTTLLAHIFLNAGFDLGEVSLRKIGKGNRPVGGGLELDEFMFANNQILEELTDGKTVEAITEHPYFQALQDSQWPAVLKDPRFRSTLSVWYAMGFVPEHLFICMRHPQEIAHSYAAHRKTNANIELGHPTTADVYAVITFCLERDIPFSFVLYPRIGEDKEYAEQIFSPFIENPWPIVEKTWKASLKHHVAEEQPVYWNRNSVARLKNKRKKNPQSLSFLN